MLLLGLYGFEVLAEGMALLVLVDAEPRSLAGELIFRVVATLLLDEL